MATLDRPCLVWTKAVSSFGYGRRKVHGHVYHVHRLAWEEAYGPIPVGMYVCHHCDVPACYEITHLFLGTQADNSHDCWAKGRGVPPHLYGESNGRARLTAEQVVEIRATVRPNRPGQRNGQGIGPAARRYGVSRGCVNHILKGDVWQPKTLMVLPAAAA